MASRIVSVDCFIFERPRQTAYLGALGPGDMRLSDDYVVRGFNGTVYPLSDKSVLVRLRDADGNEGWGETYGLVAPRATIEIIKDLFGPYLLASAALEPEAAWDGLYDLMRVRGYWGGYLADALAAIDIALWDIKGQRVGKGIQHLLSDTPVDNIAAYISGLPDARAQDRLASAQAWQEKGFDSLKIPISATDGDLATEIAGLRAGLGDGHKIAVDLHWSLSAAAAVSLSRQLDPYALWFLEAPVASEDVEAQAAVAAGINVPLALGEEWRTLWDYLPRQKARACSIVQPEMGHTGITQFMRIGRAARQAGAQIMPHATIGLGIFMSASLRAAAALDAEAHEYQHTIYDRNAELLEGASACGKGRFRVAQTPGHGVKPNQEAFRFITQIY